MSGEISTRNIIDSFGGEEAVAALLGKTVYSVRYAMYGGKFPARWYRAMQEEAAARGLPAPPIEAFNMEKRGGK